LRHYSKDEADMVVGKMMEFASPAIHRLLFNGSGIDAYPENPWDIPEMWMYNVKVSLEISPIKVRFKGKDFARLHFLDLLRLEGPQFDVDWNSLPEPDGTLLNPNGEPIPMELSVKVAGKRGVGMSWIKTVAYSLSVKVENEGGEQNFRFGLTASYGF